MKYIVYILLLIIIVSCKKEGLEVWGGSHYIYFPEKENLAFGNEDVSTDSINVSFFFYLEDEIEYPLEVALTGAPLEENTSFKIAVDKENTTLSENLYELPEYYIFKKNQVKDTIFVKLRNDPSLYDKAFDLKLDIVPTAELQIHGGKSSSRLLKVSDIAIKPEWWLENPIEWYFLGSYSRKKYELFMEVTGVSTLDLNDMGKVRLLTLEFQHWLDQQNPIVLDEDGNPMKTEIIG